MITLMASSKLPARQWLLEELPQMEASRVLHCVQGAGDILFVPPMWSHAVLNLGESIGYAIELEWGNAELD